MQTSLSPIHRQAAAARYPSSTHTGCNGHNPAAQAQSLQCSRHPWHSLAGDLLHNVPPQAATARRTLARSERGLGISSQKMNHRTSANLRVRRRRHDISMRHLSASRCRPTQSSRGAPILSESGRARRATPRELLPWGVFATVAAPSVHDVASKQPTARKLPTTRLGPALDSHY